MTTRYSIRNATESMVLQCGGINLKIASTLGVIFADLTTAGMAQLTAMGCIIKPVSNMQTHDIAPPPTPIVSPAIVGYTPQELAEAAGFGEFQTMTIPPLLGKWFNVAVLDTGIRKTHADIGGVIYEKDYSGEGNVNDGYNHGTGTAAIIKAIAPQCGILNMKIINSTGQGTDESVALAIDDILYMYDTQDIRTPCVINISLGGIDDQDIDNVMRLACREAINRGIWIVAAAGNVMSPVAGSITTPAVEQFVCAVGSVEYEPFIISAYSAIGPTAEGLIKPDVVMYGSNVNMASSLGDNDHITKSGTSFSAPLISGLYCLIFEGITRHAVSTGFLSALLSGQAVLPKMDYVIDGLMPHTCLKPDNAPIIKDNIYGYGLAFGPLAKESFKAAGNNMTAQAIQAVMPAIAVGMLARVV